MSGLKIVAVVNNFETYNRCIGENQFLSEFEKIVFDNTTENIGISERYNSFIDTVLEEDDFWVAFLHQDFMFNENPLAKIENLDKNSIYGAVGINRQLFYLQTKPKFIFKIYRRCMLGEVLQGDGNDERIIGNRVVGTPIVKTFDCCCIIVHSSVLKKLRFDENLKFHMYAEDLCYSAKKLGISSKVVQFECRHLSGGSRNEELEKSAQYVMKKHKLWRISSTCHK